MRNLKSPLTKAEISGIPKPPKGRQVVCSKCNKPGGTLLKIDDHYEHQNKTLCKMLGG